MKRLMSCLSMTTLAVVLAVPLAAQTFRVTASIPFDFMVAESSMPAGEYAVQRAGSSGSGAVQISGDDVSVVALALNKRVKPQEKTGQALLVFRRYGDQYFLARVVDGYRSTGVEIPTSRTESELSKTASIGQFETVAVLARRD